MKVKIETKKVDEVKELSRSLVELLQEHCVSELGTKLFVSQIKMLIAFVAK